MLKIFFFSLIYYSLQASSCEDQPYYWNNIIISNTDPRRLASAITWIHPTLGRGTFIFGGTTIPSIVNGSIVDPTTLSFEPLVKVYNYQTSTWSYPYLNQTTPRVGATATLIGVLVYIIGGRSASNLFEPSVDILNLLTGVWSLGLTNISPRLFATSQVDLSGSFIDIFGGMSNISDPLPDPSMMILNLALFWAMGNTPQPNPRVYSVLGADPSLNQVYLFGGAVGNPPVSEVEVYDANLLVLAWSSKGLVAQTDRIGATSWFFKGETLLFGGITDDIVTRNILSNNVISCDASGNITCNVSLSIQPNPRYGATMGENNDEFFIFGGEDNFNPRNIVNIVDVFTNECSCFGIDSSDPSVCSGNGTCISNDNCICDSGWEGDQCNISIYYCDGIIYSDPNVCNGHGDCISEDNCDCDTGYFGIYCEDTFICPEKPTWTCNGIDKNDPSVCLWGGYCASQDDCKCFNGLYGNNCQLGLQGGSPCNYSTSDNSECYSFINGVPLGGRCYPDNICKCLHTLGPLPWERYTNQILGGLEIPFGENCTEWRCGFFHNGNPNVCSGHGECILGGTTGPLSICECQSNYTDDTLECSLWKCNNTYNNNSLVCNGNGKCIDIDVCDCDCGWTGEFCNEKLNVSHVIEECPVPDCSPHFCSGRGFCYYNHINETSECDCYDGWDGEFCNISCTDIPTNCTSECPVPDCSPHFCSGNGFCYYNHINETSECDCFNGWSGSICYQGSEICVKPALIYMASRNCSDDICKDIAVDVLPNTDLNVIIRKEDDENYFYKGTIENELDKDLCYITVLIWVNPNNRMKFEIFDTKFYFIKNGRSGHVFINDENTCENCYSDFRDIYHQYVIRIDKCRLAPETILDIFFDGMIKYKYSVDVNITNKLLLTLKAYNYPDITTSIYFYLGFLTNSQIKITYDLGYDELPPSEFCMNDFEDFEDLIELGNHASSTKHCYGVAKNEDRVCSGHGVCRLKDHCECDYCYYGPMCESKYPSWANPNC